MATEGQSATGLMGVAVRGLEASRRSAVAPFLAMDVFKEAARLSAGGHSIIRMEAGEPGAPAPLRVREAAMRALQDGRIGYTQTLGIPLLREAIAQHYRDTYGVSVEPARIAVTTGSSGGFALAFLALFDAGARVAIAAPGYPAYRNILDALGIETVALATRAADRFIVTAAMIEEAHRMRPLDGVLLMSPANPTGTMMRDEELAAICATCERLGIRFISDEIYHGLTYAWPAQTALAFSQQAIVVNSFSKYYCMTGWRIGWLVLPEQIVRPVERLAQSLAISAPTLSQIAACEAFAARDELEAVKADYVKSRAMLLEELPRMGLRDFHPVDGAFYVYVNVSRFTNDSMDFCKRLLSEAGVATTPGADFDREQGAHAMRLSFAGASTDVGEGISRLARWLKT
ncbi:MAG: aminotransferase class I/II-fold pyridoxal phosphate-dependent enzyme [Alphaproteobacteria bacterium]|nr:aminotransferase class I/II-fold pyridoxal phosphate-dependent enzyme [Alphaproteobacteria bacterium]